jgi:carboxyl-terminal processing protease
MRIDAAMMNRGLLTGLGVAAGFCAGLTLLPLAYGASDNDMGAAYRELDRFGEAFSVARTHYAVPTDDRLMVEGAITGMMASLDPHSSYFDPKTFADMQVKTEGQYGGVGLVISAEGGPIKVVSPIDDTPAARAGIKAGDSILAIDGQGLAGKSLDQVQEKLRGAPGTKVVLSIMRTGGKDSFEVNLVRAAIEVEAVRFHREGDVGYIRIPAFNERTDEGVQTAVRDLKKQIGPGIKGYIIDLRDDGGGVLDAAIGVSDDFLDGGEIVSTRGRHPRDTERYDAKPGDIADGKPIIVLIDGGTASASEIVSGALQDHKRATILGTLSFGKASVQTIIPLNGGEDGALHMTTGRYYTPSGRSLQAEGIVPDIAVASSEKDADDSALFVESESVLPNHLAAEGAPVSPVRAPLIRPEPGKTYDDFQRSYAVEVLDGKVQAKAVASTAGGN